MKFDTDQLEPGLILAARSSTPYGKAIRATLGSYTNHNGLILKHNTRGWMVGEAIQPRSTYTPLSDYEARMNANETEVRIWRVNDADDDERIEVCHHWQLYCDQLDYANYTIAKLAVFRFVNSVPWKIRIHGVWCTQLVINAWRSIGRDPFLKPNGKRKKNPTPRTLENRLVSGAISDVTDRIVI